MSPELAGTGSGEALNPYRPPQAELEVTRPGFEFLPLSFPLVVERASRVRSAARVLGAGGEEIARIEPARLSVIRRRLRLITRQGVAPHSSRDDLGDREVEVVVVARVVGDPAHAAVVEQD